MTPRSFGLIALATVLAGALSGCQSSPPPPVSATGKKSAALQNMEQVAIAAHRCWFQSKDEVFADYSFANELNSFSGRPRFLLVPKGDFGGRPLLVVQAEGSAGQVEAFGPLMQGDRRGRIAADISRWTGGDSACA